MSSPENKEETNAHFPTAYCLYKLEAKKDPDVVSVAINNCDIKMEVNTGAALSIISDATFNQYFADCVLNHRNDALLIYTGELINIKGYFDVNVSYHQKTFHLPLLVVSGIRPSLLWRNWLDRIKLDWHSLFRIQHSALNDVLARHCDVFKLELGTLRDHQVSIDMDPAAHPHFYKARPLPYALRERENAEIDIVLRLGIITPVKQSQWVAPVVTVVKSDNSIRLCSDDKITVNQAS